MLNIPYLLLSDCNNYFLNILKKAAVDLQPFLFRLIPNLIFNMLSFNEILQKVEHEISQLSFEYPPKSLYDPIEYILSLGGKRIRPALSLMACNLYQENIDNAIYPALGIEQTKEGTSRPSIKYGMTIRPSFPEMPC